MGRRENCIPSKELKKEERGKRNPSSLLTYSSRKEKRKTEYRYVRQI